MIVLGTPAANAGGTAILGLIDTGTLNPNGYMEIRTGAKPATPQTTASGFVLATLPFSKPAFGTFVGGRATANAIGSSANIPTSGVATWFRIYNCDGVPILDGDITIIGGTGDIQFDNINFIQGGTVSISSLVAAVA